MKSAILATFLSAAVTISAAPGLSMDLAAPKTTADIETLTVKALVKNTGTETLKLVNDPRTVLSKAPTDTFRISSESGSPKFTGIKLKFVPEQAIAVVGNEAIFTVLTPGQSVEVEHKLAGVYNFTGAGEGSYNFAASNIFNYVDASGQLRTVTASSGSSSFKIAGKLVAPGASTRRAVRTSKRAVSFAGCDATEQGPISTAATDADKYVADTITYMEGLAQVSPRWTTWFGAYDETRYKTVYSNYKLIGTDASSTIYDCTTCRVNPPEGANYTTTYAYVHPTEPGQIYLCGAFWIAPAMGANSKAGTIVHENSHFIENAGTQDYIYGQDGAAQLAATNPEQAILNADNYEYFAENDPAQP